ncbi:MAG: FxsA family protein [Planctomycetes bacterium]|nr:FxsA family protein [Planctomycetota bacterium]
MLPLLLLLFTVVPVVELYLLLEVGRRLGAGPTIALVLLTGLAGAWMARLQGTAALRRIQGELAQGHPPGRALLEGALILVAAVLLVTPGVLTDAVGLLLLVPPTRALAARAIAAWAGARVQVVHGPSSPGGAPWQGRAPGDVIDVEAEVRDVPGPAEQAAPRAPERP